MTIATGGNPAVRRNQIHDDKQSGAWTSAAGAVLEDNDLTRNNRGAWDIAKDCASDVNRTRNKI